MKGFAKMTRQFLFAVVLSGFVALGCETESSPPVDSYSSGAPQVRVVAPDGRAFVGGSPAAIEVHRAIPNERPNDFTFAMRAGIAGENDPSGRLAVYIQQPADSMGNPEVIDVALSPERKVGDYGANADNENGPLAGRVHLELRAARMSGRVDTADGTYQIDGSFGLLCFKPQGDHGVVDENHETPLCQRFASLYP
jgi:hypothetical protein